MKYTVITLLCCSWFIGGCATHKPQEVTNAAYDTVAYLSLLGPACEETNQLSQETKGKLLLYMQEIVTNNKLSREPLDEYMQKYKGQDLSKQCFHIYQFITMSEQAHRNAEALRVEAAQQTSQPKSEYKPMIFCNKVGNVVLCN